MNLTEQTSDPSYFLSGGGEMGEIVRSFDWSESSLGHPDRWPQSLCATLGIVLHSAFPMFLFWGDDLVCFYNDAFRPSLGSNGKHPAAGKKGTEVWPEIWDFIGPLIKKVMTTGEPVWFEDQLVPFFRNGEIQEIYWTFSYSPAYGDKGKIEGVFVTCTETTEKVKLVQRLVDSERHFKSLIRDSHVGVIVLTGEDNIVEIVNDAYAVLIGRRSSELLGKPLFDIIPETESHFRSIIDTVRTTGKLVRLNEYPYFVFLHGKKKEGFLNLVYQLYKEDDGQILGVMVQCQDVTEQVISKKKAEASEQKLRSLVESAPFPIGVYRGREMRIELANQSIMDVWGKGNDLIGKLYAEVLPELDNQEIFAQLDAVFTTGIPFHARNQKVDLMIGTRFKSFYFNYSFTPLYDARGVIFGVMNTAAEVTDLNLAKLKVEQSERNFRNMILQAPVAMCIMLGPEHEVEIANDYMIELWGKPVNMVMNLPIFDALPDARGQGLEALLDNVYKTGETFKANERPVELLRKGRLEKVYQNFVYEPYRDADGSILGVLAITVDVTNQVLARLEIEQIVAERTRELEFANKSLQKSNAELAQFAYIASHDLQEPLRKISTFTQMLQSRIGDAFDEQSKNYFEKIVSSSTRMSTLIRDVLSYSELTKGEEVFVKTDLNRIVESTISDFDLLIDQKKASIYRENLPVIEAIPRQMLQLFGNIIGNALKFARKDVDLAVRILSRQLSEEEKSALSLAGELNFIKIQVSDNGIGFKPDHAEQIFNIFQRLHRKTEYAGTGIGLAMCKKIVLNHQGELNASGSSDDGAIFNIILPVAQH